MGRLARVGVEASYASFDWFEYDYDADGRIIGEQFAPGRREPRRPSPDGREVEYDYEATEGRLVRRRCTATTYEERQYVRLGDFAVGEMARSWVSGSTTRHSYIHTTEPMGLETAAFELEHPGGASVSYNPSTVVRQWTGSGVALPTRFPGQLELRGTDIR